MALFFQADLSCNPCRIHSSDLCRFQACICGFRTNFCRDILPNCSRCIHRFPCKDSRQARILLFQAPVSFYRPPVIVMLFLPSRLDILRKYLFPLFGVASRFVTKSSQMRVVILIAVMLFCPGCFGYI